MFSQKTNVCREGAIVAERTPGSHVLKQLEAQAKPRPPPLLSAPVPVSHMQSPSERKPNTGQSVELETREGPGGGREGSDMF